MKSQDDSDIHDAPAKNKGGRPVGSMSRMAREARERAQETGELPHEFLLRVSRGQAIMREVVDADTGAITHEQEAVSLEDRIGAAKAAAPYYAPRISTVEVVPGMTRKPV